MLVIDTAVNGARHSSTDSNVSISPGLPGMQGSRTPSADHKLIRCMRYSHCSSGQTLLSTL